MCIFFHLIHAFRMEFITNKNNLVEIHIIPIKTGVTNMYGMHDIVIDRETHTHTRIYGNPTQSDNSVIWVFRFTMVGIHKIEHPCE